MDALMAQQEFAAVILLYTTKLAQTPALQEEPHALCLYAEALFRMLETEAAFKQLESAKHRFPNHPLVLVEEAYLREDLKEFDKAEKLYNAAAKHAMGAYAFHAKQQLGLFYYRRQNWPKAEESLLGSVQDPLHSPVIVQYLICLYQLERFPKCLELAQQLIERGPFHQTVWELAANCYVRFNDLRSAERLLEELATHSDRFTSLVEIF